jgi:hypothetical protein
MRGTMIGGGMDVGTLAREYVVEPVEDPVPRAEPVTKPRRTPSRADAAIHRAVEAPDFAAPIVGWRTWLVVAGADGPRLESVVRAATWEPGRELVCECLTPPRRLLFRRRTRRAHAPPDGRCGCGISAARTPRQAAQYIPLSVGRQAVLGHVIGRVWLWGRVIASPLGWRGELAYPAHVYLPTPKRGEPVARRPVDLAFALTEYGVPVEVVSGGAEPDLVDTLA